MALLAGRSARLHASPRAPPSFSSCIDKRAATVSSAKNQAVAAPTTTIPFDGDHHGFDDSDSRCGGCKPTG